MPMPPIAKADANPPTYTHEDWDAVDSPELTDEELAQLRPAHEVLPPEVYAALPSRGGRPKSERPKQLVSLRLDPDVVETFKATGPGWQTRMNAVLAEAARKLRTDRAW
ncbi:BrnA antitoxin family protein [Methylobacterium sp. ap11]|uniref:BrnA antitoxin family protein n=1 Tax=Methylobacterium sp. ap11 TaxID=1761799 RepID=UPI000B832B15|nr:BrnA antitoxin family protein [Methylobacterium sp. ap11]